MITLKVQCGAENIDDALEIRKQVFIEEQAVPHEIERDEYDKISKHAIIYENEMPVATGRFVYKDNQYTIGRVAVIREHRDKKYGVMIVNALVDIAFQDNVSEIHIHAQKSVEGFYAKLGFTPYGDEFEEAGIRHIGMVIRK